MPIDHYLKVIWRRKWITLLVVLAALVLVGPGISATRNEFIGTVKLLVTLPEISTVDLYGSYRSSTAQDEVNLARNNFADIVNGSEVRARTIEALGLSESLRSYGLEVEEPRDSDFLVVKVRAPERVWAAEIANTHAEEALTYFGEIRARPAAAAKGALNEQLEEARIQLVADEQAVLSFEDANGISSLDDELNLQREVLTDLYLRRNRYTVEGTQGLSLAYREIIQILEAERLRALEHYQAIKAAALEDVIGLYTDNTIDLLEQYRAETAVMQLTTIDALIEREEENLSRLTLLKPELDELEFRLVRSEARVQQLLDAYQEASTKEGTALKVNFVHVVLPATPPLQPDTRTATMLLLLTVVGSIGLGLILAFGVDYLLSQVSVQKPLPEGLERRR